MSCVVAPQATSTRLALWADLGELTSKRIVLTQSNIGSETPQALPRNAKERLSLLISIAGSLTYPELINGVVAIGRGARAGHKQNARRAAAAIRRARRSTRSRLNPRDSLASADCLIAMPAPPRSPGLSPRKIPPAHGSGGPKSSCPRIRTLWA